MTEPLAPIELRTPTERKEPSPQNQNADGGALTQVYLPRITIKYCTQCKWMLRAAYVSGYLFLCYFYSSSVLFFSSCLYDMFLLGCGLFLLTLWMIHRTEIQCY